MALSPANTRSVITGHAGDSQLYTSRSPDSLFNCLKDINLSQNLPQLNRDKIEIAVFGARFKSFPITNQVKKLGYYYYRAKFEFTH